MIQSNPPLPPPRRGTRRGISTAIDQQLRPFPDHTQLPESDGTFGKNFQEHPQSILLTDSIVASTGGRQPPLNKVQKPRIGFMCLDSGIRRSYVLWREYITPLIALEFASGTGAEERDRTPLQAVDGTVQKPGKFWVYEQIIRIPYYGIFIINRGELEVYHWEDGTYERLSANQRGHYAINRMNVELGVWRGTYLGQPEQPWLRSWDPEGNLLLTGKERAAIAQNKAEQERQKRQQLVAQLKALSPEQLQALGIEPALLE